MKTAAATNTVEIIVPPQSSAFSQEPIQDANTPLALFVVGGLLIGGLVLAIAKRCCEAQIAATNSTKRRRRRLVRQSLGRTHKVSSSNRHSRPHSKSYRDSSWIICDSNGSGSSDNSSSCSSYDSSPTSWSSDNSSSCSSYDSCGSGNSDNSSSCSSYDSSPSSWSSDNSSSCTSYDSSSSWSSDSSSSCTSYDSSSSSSYDGGSSGGGGAGSDW